METNGKTSKRCGARKPSFRARVWLAVAIVGLCRLPGATEPVLAEYQVKAAFLVNFTRYVNWPESAWSSPSSPFVIGIVGENNFGDYLRNAIEAKNVAGHQMVLQQIGKDEDLARCHLLFISGSEKKHLAEVLSQVRSAPVLTVGESEQFTQRGGVIGFIKKEGKIRLQIDLEAARQASLKISSKLLNVADTVSGKP